MTRSVGRHGLGGAAAVVALVLSGSAQAAEPSPPGASSCSGCHAAGSPVGALAGAPAAGTASALAAYRSGERPGTLMPRIATGFSEAESKAIAEWWSRQERQP